MPSFDLDQTASNVNSAINQIIDSSTDLNIDSATFVVDKSTNNIGIGNNAPAVKLHITNTTDEDALNSLSGILISNTDSTNNSGSALVFSNSAGSNGWSRIAVVRTATETTDMIFTTMNGGTGTEKLRIKSDGKVGIGTTNPSAKLHVNGDTYLVGNVGVNLATASVALDINGDSLRIRTAKTPASASASGHQGQISWDADYLYVCTATNTWKRVAIAW
jgi:hypothetical protein